MSDKDKENPGSQVVYRSGTLTVTKENRQTDQGETETRRIEVSADGAVSIQNLYITDHSTIDNRQMLAEPSSSQAEQTVAYQYAAVQRLRKLLNDLIERECYGPVTEDFDDLEEPLNEVYPKLLKLLKFYEGDLLKKMSQYQTDSAFRCGSLASSPGEDLDYAAFLRRVIESDRIALIGQAGSGKSTMLKRLVRDLTKHDEDLLIFFMNFRDFTDSKEITPRDLLFRGLLPDSDAKHSYQWILENRVKVILVFDGLDQATWSVTDEAKLVGPYGTGKVSEIMSSIFKGKLFPNFKVVYSSREHAVASLVGQLRPKMVVALTGLCPADSERLFKSFIGEDGEMLWKKLRKQAPSLIPLLSIPAFLIFTAIIFKLNSDNPPRFMTQVLKNLMDIFMQSGHIIEKDIPVVITGLKKLSFFGMKDGKVIFHIVDVRNAGLNEEEICDWIIRIPGLNKYNQFLLEGKYVLVFSHQIIQEFLAAQYMVELDFESFESIANEYLMRENWSVVNRFVTGLLFNKEIDVDMDTVPDVEMKRNTLVFLLARQNKVSHFQSAESLAAISESNDDIFIENSLPGISLIDGLDVGDAYIIASVMRHLTHLCELGFRSCNHRYETLRILCDDIEDSDLKVSKLDVSVNKFELEEYTMIGKLVVKYSVDELVLQYCRVTNEDLGKLLSACEGAKISKIDISNNTLEDVGYATLGKIVQMCAVEELTLRQCDLNDRMLQYMLSETEGAKISKLDISMNYIGHTGFSTLGRIVKMRGVSELILQNCYLYDGELENLLTEIEGTEISKLNVSYNSMLNDIGYATLGKIVQMCGVNELCLWFCNLNEVKLKNFVSETEGAKIARLDVSANSLNEDTAVLLGDIVKQCSVEELTMHWCGLNDVLLEALLSSANGGKLSFLDVTRKDHISFYSVHGWANNISESTLENITRSITVKHD